MSDLQLKLKRDETYLRYRSILRTVQETMNLEKIGKEASYLHRNRKSRGLYELRVSPIKLQNALLQDMSNRSRLTELKALLLNQQELIKEAISLGKRHVRTTYADIISQFGTTKEAQNLVVDKVFSRGISTLSQIDSSIDILDLYIKDIDSCGYALKNTIETLKMLLDRKEAVSV